MPIWMSASSSYAKCCLAKRKQNQALLPQRPRLFRQAVQRQLEGLAPALAARLRSEAATPDEALIGSASDDWRDALDRRVDFKLRPC